MPGDLLFLYTGVPAAVGFCPTCPALSGATGASSSSGREVDTAADSAQSEVPVELPAAKRRKLLTADDADDSDEEDDDDLGLNWRAKGVR